jgi:predicted ester cyclase
MGARAVVERFWRLMQQNDFRGAGVLLHDQYVLEWPQTGERIRGRGNFVAVNEGYPAAGRWTFTIHRIVAEGNTVVTDVGVTDGARSDRAITFSEVRDGRIVESWGQFDALGLMQQLGVIPQATGA